MKKISKYREGVLRANRGAKASDFYRGLAMGYGYFYHTGKLL